MDEAGYPQMAMISWNGLMAPAATPAQVAAKINSEVARIVATPEMRARIVEQGYQPITMGVDDAQAFVAGDVARWARLIREANIKAD